MLQFYSIKVTTCQTLSKIVYDLKMFEEKIYIFQYIKSRYVRVFSVDESSYSMAILYSSIGQNIKLSRQILQKKIL